MLSTTLPPHSHFSRKRPYHEATPTAKRLRRQVPPSASCTYPTQTFLPSQACTSPTAPSLLLTAWQPAPAALEQNAPLLEPISDSKMTEAPAYVSQQDMEGEAKEASPLNDENDLPGIRDLLEPSSLTPAIVNGTMLVMEQRHGDDRLRIPQLVLRAPSASASLPRPSKHSELAWTMMQPVDWMDVD
ncbi:hypothetical protein BC940DRAFT_349686 [Gongronella butleri]|nr:hypothetical protein BC940DRAFT_349686 [Gongronella butleri]